MLKERGKFDIDSFVMPEEFMEPLPPTPITIEAKIRLRRWGVPDEFVERLRSMAALFRYDRCPQKLARVARKGGYLFKLDEGGEAVILPDYFDGKVRLDGQCGDIASQLIRALNYSGFLASLNAVLATSHRPKILPVCSIGLSKTHFNTEEATHVWTGLIQEGADPENQVGVDASFQEIANLEISGYKLGKKPTINPRSFSVDKAAVVPVCELTIDENGGHHLIDFNSTILGISGDGRFAYGLGFARQSGARKIYSFITLLREDGGPVLTGCLGSDAKDNIWFGPTADVEGGHRKEVGQMLDSLEKMRVWQSQRKARKWYGKTAIVQTSP